MHYELTDEQVRNYRDNGFIVIDNFLTPEEVEDWRSKVMGAVRARAGQKMAWERSKDRRR